MRLKKIVLHNEHEVMDSKEMKQVLGGQVIVIKKCGKSENGVCSVYCDPTVENGKLKSHTCTKLTSTLCECV